MTKWLRALIVLVILCALGSLALIEWPLRPREGPPGPAVSDGSGGNEAFGQFTPLDPPRPAPGLTFTERDGTPRQLGDFRGHWVLINLWATWCAPCIEEMPSLSRLRTTRGDRLTILPISQDRGGAAVVDPFLAKLDLGGLRVYLDPKDAAGQALQVRGLPTSFLVDPQGRLVARLEGKADWDAPATLTKLDAYLRRAESQG
jgi:thiol-disulfide isomerase/thioredoxin